MAELGNSTSQNILSTENQISLPCGSLNGESDDNNVSATLIDLEAFDCPVCCDFLSEIIFQCENGHIACSTCCTKLKNKCTLCDLPIGKIRNRVMERVMKAIIVPCPNASFGCTKSISYSQGSTHNKECVFSPCYCPALDCNYKGSYKDLFKHFLGHMDNLVPSRPISYGDLVAMTVNFRWLKYNYVVLKELDDTILFVVQFFRGSHGIYVTVSCIAPSSLIVGEFSSRIIIDGEKCKMTFEFPEVKIVRKLSLQFHKEDYMFIPSYALLENRLSKFSICISKLDKKA